MNIREMLAFGAKSLGNPDEAQLLLSYTLQTPKLLLTMEPNRQVTAEQHRAYQAVIARRIAHEPVAYITGTKEFFGLTFHVEPGVLIPRPETEFLVEQTLAVLDEHSTPASTTKSTSNPPATVIIDVGTGSGAIACAIAANLPTAQAQYTTILATEFSKIAFGIAKTNIARLNLSQTIELLPGNGILPALQKRAFIQATHVVIVANLPYIPTQDYLALMPDVKNFEPREALDGGTDGLDMYRVLLNQLEDLVRTQQSTSKTYTLLAEIDPSQSQILPQEIKKRFPHAETQVHKDLNGLHRFIQARIH